MLRIIAGERRGHRFEGPGNRELRATSDMVREAIFNILREEVEDRVVMDLFAGTGALGLEALSRGARKAVFVEKDRNTAGLIHKNIATLRYEDRTQVVCGDAYRWVAGHSVRMDGPSVVFLDPPYRDFETRPAKFREMLASLAASLPGESVILVESGKLLGEDVLPSASAWVGKRYGSTHLAILRLIEEGEGEGGVGAEADGVVEEDDGAADVPGASADLDSDKRSEPET